ncbi:hypothetical protein Tco_0563880 [Tanacetum coccineum]
MVACLERSDENTEFHQIVDFLTTSSIHYALTVSPTIYASYIEQFWATAKSKTVNDVKQIHATVDDKTMVISESSVRNDLHFNDEDGITCLSNDEIFVNHALMGVLALENLKTTQDLVIQKLKKRVKRLEKALRERTPWMMLFKIGTSKRKGLDKENGTLNSDSINVSTAGPSNVSDTGPSTSTAGDIFEDEMTPISDTLVAIRSARQRTILVMICNVEEEPRRATLMDEELAQRLSEEEQAQFEKEQRIARKKSVEHEAKDASLIEQMEDVQARMDADELLAERLQQEEREQFTVDEQARMLVDLIVEKKKFFDAHRGEQIRNKPPTIAQLRNKMWQDDGDSQKQTESSKKRPSAKHDEESVKQAEN